MDNIQNTSQEGVQTGTEGAQQGKTFNQDDVDRIVQNRLSKEHAKIESEFAEKEKELERREFILDARKELNDRGYPESIMDALNTTDSDSFKKSLDILDAFMKERGIAKTDKNLEQRRSRLVTPLHRQGNNSIDDIRAAMGLH